MVNFFIDVYTFFPEKDISGFKEYINTLCVILSFLSAGLGCYSIWQAFVSDKHAEKIINSLQTIEREQRIAQDLMRVMTNTLDNGSITKTADASINGSWKPDKDVV